MLYFGESMDIRVIKSNRKITDAFVELRSRKPIEKISVTELCKLAGVNKSTFYAHYQDIYDLSDKIETRIVEDVVSSIEAPENILKNPNVFTKELFYAYMDNEKIISVIFSGSRAALLPQKTEYIIKKLLFKFHPEYENDIEMNVLFSIKIYGGFYAFHVNKKYEPDKVIAIIGKLNGSK